MLVDPDLQNNYVESEVEQLIQVALLCTQGSPMDRPKMSEVVRMLEGDGLAERWDEWQKVEILRQEIDLSPHPNSDWIVDSTENLHAVELSGPRWPRPIGSVKKRNDLWLKFLFLSNHACPDYSVTLHIVKFICASVSHQPLSICKLYHFIGLSSLCHAVFEYLFPILISILRLQQNYKARGTIILVLALIESVSPHGVSTIMFLGRKRL